METIQINSVTHRLLVECAGRRGEDLGSTILFLVRKQLGEEGVPVDPASVEPGLPPFESPHTNAQFAQWLGVSIETVKRMSKRTPGRLTVGSGGRCVRWHIPTYLAALR